jgi:hypothetical protein
MRVTRRHRLRMAIAGTAAAGLALPIAAQAALFPYQYSYVNAAAQAMGVQVDVDYWDTSLRDLLPSASEEIRVICPHWSTPERMTRTGLDCRTRRTGTVSTFWQASGRPAYDVPARYEFDVLLRGTQRVPGFCQTTHRVARWHHFERVTISRLMRCERSRPPKQQRVVNPWESTWSATRENTAHAAL